MKNENNYVVDESIYGNWFYHIRKMTEKQSLCDAKTLGKELPIHLFGYKSSNVNEKYCLECKKMYQEKI